MAKFVDKTRVGIPGGGPKLKGVLNQEAWGAKAAVDRGYCKGVEYPMGTTEAARGVGPYDPQHKEDRASDLNYNDLKGGWMRGMSPNQAEDRPGYQASWRAPTSPRTGDDYKVGHRPG